MKKKTKIFNIFLLFSFYLFLFVSLLNAEKHVLELNIPVKEKINKAQMLTECFSYSIKEEIKMLLSHTLSEEKLDKIINFLNEKQMLDNFILYYKEKTVEKTSSTLKKQVSVFLDTSQLKEFLKKLGFYYAPEGGWRCSVETENLTQGDLNLLQEMISISNCSCLNVAPDLRIKIIYNSASKLFWGKMNYKDFVWEGVEKEVQKVWTRLWRDFIRVSDVQKVYTKSTKLFVYEFGGVCEVRYTDRLLKKRLNIAVDSVKLNRIEVKPSGITAVWDIRFLPAKLKLLKARLNKSLFPKALQYRLK